MLHHRLRAFLHASEESPRVVAEEAESCRRSGRCADPFGFNTRRRKCLSTIQARLLNLF